MTATLPIFLEANPDKRIGHAYIQGKRWEFNLNQYHNPKSYELIPISCAGKIIAWSAKKK